MAYEVHGTGFPLLLINGLGSDRREWLGQVPAFARHFRVIAFDNRGMGIPPGRRHPRTEVFEFVTLETERGRVRLDHAAVIAGIGIIALFLLLAGEI